MSPDDFKEYAKLITEVLKSSGLGLGASRERRWSQEGGHVIDIGALAQNVREFEVDEALNVVLPPQSHGPLAFPMPGLPAMRFSSEEPRIALKGQHAIDFLDYVGYSVKVEG